MYFLFDNGGQTCNKLWSYFYSIIDLKLNRSKGVILFYDCEIRKFPTLLDNPYLKYPFYCNAFINKVGMKHSISFLHRVLEHKCVNIVKCIRTLFPNRILEGWNKRGVVISEDLRNEVMELFHPCDEVREKVNGSFAKEYRSCDCIIGLHIRYGDYRTAWGGKFFFPIKIFNDICSRLCFLYPEKRIKFFISTNENLDLSDFKYSYFFIKDSCAITDLYALSRCDYIIGPPSSFSRWASFYGKTPLAMLTSHENYDLDFHVYTSYYDYEDGGALSSEYKQY